MIADDDEVGSIESLADRSANPSSNPTIAHVIAERLSRREVLAGALAVAGASGAALVSTIATPVAAVPPSSEGRTFSFAELTAGVDETHHVASGYDAEILVRWGDTVLDGAPAFDPAAPSADAQSRQFGYNNDFIGYFPLDGRSDHGLLVVNHEYTNDELMYPGLLQGRRREAAIKDMSAELVAASMAAHGGSVLEIARQDGKWRVVEGSRFARRVTAETPTAFSGPAAGHRLMVTEADPEGRRGRGMINNCAGGVTPWGTWLTCEENFDYYFWNPDGLAAHPERRALERYGVPAAYYPWGRYHERFDIAKVPNECNRFGWVVEIDPFDPEWVPVKRTAMGRFKHEGAAGVLDKSGHYVVYQGDDQRFDYVYKFVTARKFDAADRAANLKLLDEGTLYVARFEADGTGAWMPLVAGHEKLGAFADQGQILIHARLASDALGATKMDRPEDIEVSPRTGKVYVMLTNNKQRAKDGDKGIDAANPRPDNKFGHIIEITPDAGDHTATTFRWEFLVKCGDPAIAEVGATFNPATSADGWFGMPDNCAFDAEGRLWIATDGNSQAATGRADGVWAMETEGPLRGTSKLFFRCPVGAEMCGPCFTPDLETLFVAVQHPGDVDENSDPPSSFEAPRTRWPDFVDGRPPRPSVVAITRRGGGKIAV